MIDRDGRIELLALQAALIAAVPRTDFSAAPTVDYTSTLRAALAACRELGLSPIADALGAVQSLLPWTYHYPTRADEKDLARRIAFAELVGPDGPMLAPRMRVGFTLMAPRTVYPMHAHPAVELYWVMQGTALWSSQHGAAMVPPGEFVLHRSGDAHSMRTFDDTLLALWGWSGDIDTPAFYL